MKQKVVGVLDTDIIVPELNTSVKNYTELFSTLFAAVDKTICLERYSVIEGQYPPDTNACDGYIITGSKFSAYDNCDWIEKLIAYIKVLHAQRKKIVGVCFGHQILAMALGGQVNRAGSGWGVGAMDYEVLCPRPWMHPEKSELTLLVSHQDQVIVLPPGATLLATSAFCENACFELDDTVLGLQAHPEFTVAYSRLLMQHRAEDIGTERVAAGEKSLTRVLDSLAVGHWMANFLFS